MSFYTVIKTELKSKKYIICALEELKRRGEITRFEENARKETIDIERGSDRIEIVSEKGAFGVAGDNRVVQSFSNKLKQMYAYEAIKDTLPLDFEIAAESETGGEIKILLKG